MGANSHFYSLKKLPKDPRKMQNEFFARLKTRIGFFGDLLVIFG